MKNIMVLGSLNMDLVTKVHATPKVGETIHGDGFDKIPGGKGANQAAAIGRIGGNVAMIGKVGDDEFGEILIESLEKNGVDCDFVTKVDDISSGTALIMVNDDGDNSIVVIPGANFELKPEDITEDMFEDVDFLLAQLETPMKTIEPAFRIAKNMGIYTILNPAPAKELSPELIANTNLLIPNETEFKSITGFSTDTESELKKGTDYLFKNNLEAIIITLGSNGAQYIDKYGSDLETSAYTVDAVDTTAAGDSFIGGFLTALSAGKSIVDAMDNGAKVAAITVSRFGAQSSLPSKEELENFNK